LKELRDVLLGPTDVAIAKRGSLRVRAAGGCAADRCDGRVGAGLVGRVGPGMRAGRCGPPGLWSEVRRW